MAYHYMERRSRSWALHERVVAIETIHTILGIDERDPILRELDQMTLDGLVEFLWELQKRWGLTPHICFDRYCLCHVVIAEGKPDLPDSPSTIF